MIKTDRQYKITKAQIAKFEAALEEPSRRARSGAKPALQKLEKDALRSQLDELRAEVKRYELLKHGQRQPAPIASFDQLPLALVEARICAGLSQKGLAERLGLQEQQIQRYEATDYASASLTRIKEVAEALGVTIKAELACAGR